MVLSEANESEPVQNTPLLVREFITSDSKTSGEGGSGVVSSATWRGNRGHLLSIMGRSPQSVGHVSLLASRATASSTDTSVSSVPIIPLPASHSCNTSEAPSIKR